MTPALNSRRKRRRLPKDSNIFWSFRQMRDILVWSRRSLLFPRTQRRGANTRLVQLRAALVLVTVLFLTLANGTVSVVAAESVAIGIPDNNVIPGDADAYLAWLRTALPQSWLQREFQRQRSFPAFAHSRQLVAKGQYEEAFEELEKYVASDPDDLVIQFGYLILATELKRYRAAIGAADRILVSVPDFAPALFYRGLARAAWAKTKKLWRTRRRGG